MNGGIYYISTFTTCISSPTHVPTLMLNLAQLKFMNSISINVKKNVREAVTWMFPHPSELINEGTKQKSSAFELGI